LIVKLISLILSLISDINHTLFHISNPFNALWIPVNHLFRKETALFPRLRVVFFYADTLIRGNFGGKRFKI